MSSENKLVLAGGIFTGLILYVISRLRLSVSLPASSPAPAPAGSSPAPALASSPAAAPAETFYPLVDVAASLGAAGTVELAPARPGFVVALYGGFGWNETADTIRFWSDTTEIVPKFPAFGSARGFFWPWPDRVTQSSEPIFKTGLGAALKVSKDGAGYFGMRGKIRYEV